MGRWTLAQLCIKIAPMDCNIDIALSSFFYNVHYVEMFIHIILQSQATSNISLYMAILLFRNNEKKCIGFQCIPLHCTWKDLYLILLCWVGTNIWVGCCGQLQFCYNTYFCDWKLLMDFFKVSNQKIFYYIEELLLAEMKVDAWHLPLCCGSKLTLVST